MEAFFRFINKLVNLYYSQYNKTIFKNVKCDISKIKIGADVNRNFNLKFPQNILIGDGTSISGNCYINAYGGVEIGQFCHIATGLTIFSHNHNFKSKTKLPYDAENILKRVKIGDVVWIGANVSIAPGATIGNGVIISMGSVVFGDIPDMAIIRGNPAVVVGYRDKDVFSKLFNEKAFC